MGLGPLLGSLLASASPCDQHGAAPGRVWVLLHAPRSPPSCWDCERLREVEPGHIHPQEWGESPKGNFPGQDTGVTAAEGTAAPGAVNILGEMYNVALGSSVPSVHMLLRVSFVPLPHYPAAGPDPRPREHRQHTSLCLLLLGFLPLEPHNSPVR